MKKLIFLLIFSFIRSNAQQIRNSIRYDKTLKFREYGDQIGDLSFYHYPNDLSENNIFFINIEKSETHKNTGTFSPRSGMINSKIKKHASEYPYILKIFPKEFKQNNWSFYIEKGFKYRLIIRSNWDSRISSYGSKLPSFEGRDFAGNGVRKSNYTSATVYDQFFTVILEDITTGELYGNTNNYRFRHFWKRFLADIVNKNSIDSNINATKPLKKDKLNIEMLNISSIKKNELIEGIKNGEKNAYYEYDLFKDLERIKYLKEKSSRKYKKEQKRIIKRLKNQYQIK